MYIKTKPRHLGVYEKRKHNNEPQKIIEKALTEKGYRLGVDFIPEMAVIIKEKRMYVDIGFPKSKIVVEIDGKIHQTRQAKYADKKRDKQFWKWGWRVVRIKDELIMENIDECISIIEAEL